MKNSTIILIFLVAFVCLALQSSNAEDAKDLCKSTCRKAAKLCKAKCNCNDEKCKQHCKKARRKCIMKNIFLLFIVIVAVIEYVNGQCGCRAQYRKLLKRSLSSVKLGDMLLDATDIAIINGFKNHYANSKKWPNNVVLYSFAGNFPRDKIGAVRESLGELQNDLRGCVKFQESTNGHYIEVNSKREGCYSLLGFTGGPNQPLNLENPGCLYSKGTIKHEFMHALGFMHTHMRKDRDQHISINWARILSSQCSQFVKCDGCEPDGPYETESVMHYNSEGFACVQGEKVVLKKNGGAIGYNHGTTQNDLAMIRNFYNCR